MAESNRIMHQRLERVEQAIAHVADILIDQSARIDYGFRTAREENRLVVERLDRLIAATIRDRTQTADRLADIELRLAKLEERAGG